MTGHLCPGPGDDHRDHRLRDTPPLESRPVEESLAAFEVALSVPSPGPARLPPLTADAHETRGDGAWRTPHNGARRHTGVPAGPTQLPQQPWQNGRQAHRMRTPEDSRGFRGVSPSARPRPTASRGPGHTGPTQGPASMAGASEALEAALIVLGLTYTPRMFAQVPVL